MLKVTSSHIKATDRALLKRFASYVLGRFVRRGILRKTIIILKVVRPEELTEREAVHDLRKFKAWVINDGMDGDRRKFTVILNVGRYNKRAILPWVRLKNIMLDVGHEMVHIKQYLNGELFDYASGNVRYKGELFPANLEDAEEAYFDSPWEIEAYGREYGLYRMFAEKLKAEAKILK